MQETSNSFLTEQPVGRLMVRYAVPCVISLLVAALYNIVDQIFIGMPYIWALTAMRPIRWYFR